MLRTSLPRFGDRIEFSGLSVSPYCLGMTASATAIEAAFEAGINFFFLTGDMHWPAYETNRKALASLFSRPGVRDQVVVCGTSYVTQPAFREGPFFELVEAVPGLERIDVLCAGGMYRSDFAPRLAAYRQSKAERLCGALAIAASFHDRAVARDASAGRLVDLAFIRLNPLHPGSLTDYFPAVTPGAPPTFSFKSNFAALNREQMARAGLTAEQWWPDVTDYYRYALSEPRLDGLLLSLEAPSQLDALDAALAKGALIADECEYLETLTKAAFKKGV